MSAARMYADLEIEPNGCTALLSASANQLDGEQNVNKRVKTHMATVSPGKWKCTHTIDRIQLPAWNVPQLTANQVVHGRILLHLLGQQTDPWVSARVTGCVTARLTGTFGVAWLELGSSAVSLDGICAARKSIHEMNGKGIISFQCS